MNKEQTRGIVIAIIVTLVVVIGGIYYYKKNILSVPQDTSIIEENNVNTDTEESPNPDTSSTADSSVENKTKFNSAMTNAATAFGKGSYDTAIKYYKEALTYENADTAYSGLFTVYGAKGDWASAQIALDSAIALNPRYTDYWKSKLNGLDEKTNATYTQLKKVYTEGLSKVDPKTKINLVTYFATIAEGNNEKAEAISLWQYAKDIYPANSAVYQAEIDRLEGDN